VVVGVSLLLMGACGDDAASPCATPSSENTCLALRVVGTSDNGQLGFRFGPPLDVDGDGIADLAAGARYGEIDGTAGVWSGATGLPLASWKGELSRGLFGHAVLPVADLDGDGLADVIVSAPLARPDEIIPHGVLYGFSPATGQELWRAVGAVGEAFGWHLDASHDHDGDGVADVWVGAPGDPQQGRVYLVSGRTGATITAYASPRSGDQFGWYLANLPDIDGDGRDDLVVGAPVAFFDGEQLGAVDVISSASGQILVEITGDRADKLFGEMLEPIDDLDGDGFADLAIGASGMAANPDRGPGEVFFHSGKTGALLRWLGGRQDGELYGRALAVVGDLDDDGMEDLAIGAPWSGTGATFQAGRVEIRSLRGFSMIAEITGEHPEFWLGWHIARGEHLADGARRGFAISSIDASSDGKALVGAVEVHTFSR
jgi:hypothetical protein